MRHGVVVRERVDHEERQTSVEDVQRVPGRVEEEHVAEAEDEARHGERQHRQQLGKGPAGGKQPQLLDEVGPAEHDRRADGGHRERHGERVPVGRPAVGIGRREVVMVERQAEIVGPVADERGPDRDPVGARDHAGHEHRVGQRERITNRVGLGLVGHRAGREQGRLPALDQAVDHEGQHGGHQHQQADDGAHGEVLLADHLPVGVGGQHRVLAADHLRDAEIRDHQGEDHEGRADESVAGPRQGHGEEGTPAARPHCGGGLVEAPVGEAEGGDEDDQGVREGVEAFREGDADRPVDAAAEQQAAQEALVAEDVGERDARQQRGREQRQERQRQEQTLERHRRAGERVGVAESQRHHDSHDAAGDGQAVEQGLDQGRRREVGAEVRQPRHPAIRRLQALDQQRAEGQRDDEQEEQAQARDERDADRGLGHGPVFRGRGLRQNPGEAGFPQDGLGHGAAHACAATGKARRAAGGRET
ncbi:hypothetical protein CFIICLFH_3779 [Methylobacterium goesingense]|nr:hypothetical protein CFIICLFH_3779 [Methylobacterium goesingense]